MLYTVDEAAALLRVSARWPAEQCQAERVEHVHLARHRLFTHGQMQALIELIESNQSGRLAVARLDATRAQVIRLLARRSR